MLYPFELRARDFIVAYGVGVPASGQLARSKSSSSGFRPVAASNISAVILSFIRSIPLQMGGARCGYHAIC